MAPLERICGHCDAVQQHDDDFCHECGHSFDWSAPDKSTLDEWGDACPVCATGEVLLDHDGIRQCDSCGYTARDWSAI